MAGGVLLTAVLLTARLALADIGAELTLASDPALPEASRRAAFDRLVAEGSRGAQPIIMAAQQGEDTRRRWVAIRALGHIGGPQATSALLALLEDKEPAIRTAALSALGDLGQPSLSARVIEGLADPAVIVRAAAAESLGKLRDPRAIRPLAEALDSPASYYRGASLWVRRMYVEALGAIGDRRALPVLLGAMEDADPAVAEASLRALEQVTGVSFADGRSPAEEREAWRRWGSAQIIR